MVLVAYRCNYYKKDKHAKSILNSAYGTQTTDISKDQFLIRDKMSSSNNFPRSSGVPTRFGNSSMSFRESQRSFYDGNQLSVRPGNSHKVLSRPSGDSIYYSQIGRNYPKYGTKSNRTLRSSSHRFNINQHKVSPRNASSILVRGKGSRSKRNIYYSKSGLRLPAARNTRMFSTVLEDPHFVETPF